MRANLRPDVSDDALLAALTSTRVVLQAGRDVLGTHSGQTALIAAALTLARSGHEVWVDAEETQMLRAQPPLRPGALLAALSAAGRDLLPGRDIAIGRPSSATLAIAFGMGHGEVVPAEHQLFFDADDWTARLRSEPTVWSGNDWPFGAIGAAAIAAAEAFKAAMRPLTPFARAERFFTALHRPTTGADFAVAPPGTPKVTAVPAFDLISAGAITNAVLFTLLRCPGISGAARVLDDDVSALSNLNRNALLLRSALELNKVSDLARQSRDLVINPQPRRFVAGDQLAANVLVGVDHIPSRWAAQQADPSWLGVGATEGYVIQVSSHRRGEPCAGCLHPVAPAAPGDIPTVAFVSLTAGLLLAARWVESLSTGEASAGAQQTFLNALRPESWSSGDGAVAPHDACPVGCAASRRRAA